MKMKLKDAGVEYPKGYKRLHVYYRSEQHKRIVEGEIVFDPCPLAFANCLEALAKAVRQTEERDLKPGAAWGEDGRPKGTEDLIVERPPALRVIP